MPVNCRRISSTGDPGMTRCHQTFIGPEENSMTMKRGGMQSFLAALMGCALLSGLAAGAEKPNVVFLLADDMGYMDIGANNPKCFYETPNVNNLAKEGMRFTDGYAACPVCSPTRATSLPASIRRAPV